MARRCVVCGNAVLRLSREAYAASRGSLERVCLNPDCGRTFTPTRIDAKRWSRKCRDRLAYLRRTRGSSRSTSGRGFWQTVAA
jgi:hypothetical protein